MGSLTKPWRGTRKPNLAARTRKEAVPKQYNNDVGKVSNLHFYIFNQICAGAIEQGDAHQAAQVNFLQCDTWAGRQADFSGFTERSRARLYRIAAKPSAPGCLVQTRCVFRPGVFSSQIGEC